MAKRIVIVGAGPGGLASAMLLAKAGLDVRVIERLSRPGGRTGSLRNGGFRFDIGPTFFLYPRILEEIFAAVGRDLHAEVPMRRLDPQYRLVFEQGGRIDATADIPRMKRELARLNPHDANHFENYLADNRAKLDGFRPILESPFNNLRDVMRLPLRKLLPLLRPGSSIDGDLKRHFSDERIRLAFSFQSKYLGMSPFQCPSLFTILSFLEYEYGVWHPIGGCGEISEAMARIAREMGVKIHLGEPVERIHFAGRKVTGVRTPAGDYDADAIVVNADFARAMTRLVPDHLRPRWSNRKLAKKKFSCSTFMMYLGVEGLSEDLPHHTIFLAEDYRKNLDEIERKHVLSENPSFYVQNAGVTDETLAPPGCSTLYVLVPVTHQHPNVDWSKQREPFLARTLQQLRKLGLHDLEHRIRYKKIITPADWDRGMEIHRGATFNLAHNLRQMLHLRPRNRFAELDGVYLVGGGTHPGSGLPVIFESAKISSRLVLDDFGLPAGDLLSPTTASSRTPTVIEQGGNGPASLHQVPGHGSRS